MTCHSAAACMTWDLAESGKHFITTIINGSDLVPTFSAASVDDLRSEVMNFNTHAKFAVIVYLFIYSYCSIFYFTFLGSFISTDCIIQRSLIGFFEESSLTLDSGNFD